MLPGAEWSFSQKWVAVQGSESQFQMCTTQKVRLLRPERRDAGIPVTENTTPRTTLKQFSCKNLCALPLPLGINEPILIDKVLHIGIGA